MRSMIFFAVIGVFVLGSSQVFAKYCTVTGQGLVAAYTIAVQNGYRFRNESTRLPGRFYTQPSPGKIGFKASKRGNVFTKFNVVFFSGMLKNSWKLKKVNYSGNPTAIRKSLKGGNNSDITFSWAAMDDGSGNLKAKKIKFDVYISALTFEHPTKSCGRDLVTQQIALQNMFSN